MATVGESVSGTYWGMLFSRDRRVALGATDGNGLWVDVLFEAFDRDEAVERRDVAPPRRGTRCMLGNPKLSVPRPLTLPISVPTLSIEATPGAEERCSALAAAVDPLGAPREATDMSEARLAWLVRPLPLPFGSLSASSMVRL